MRHKKDDVKGVPLRVTLNTDERTGPLEQFQSMEISVGDSEIVHNLHLLQNLSFSLDLGGKEISMEDLAMLVPQYPLISGLNLYEAGIDNQCMQVLSKLTALKHLELSHNDIDDEGMQYLAFLKRLEKLTIVYNKITARGIQYITTLPNLEEVDAGCTYLGNEGIQAISRSDSIRILNIRTCGFDDQALDYLSTMSNLQKVILSNNQISSSALQAFIEKNRNRGLEVIAEDLI